MLGCETVMTRMLRLPAVRDRTGRSASSIYDDIQNWKLIETTLPQPRVELYRLSDDPEEQRDLVHEEPHVASEMLDHLRTFVESLPVGRGGLVELTEYEKARLRALGYLD